MSVPDVAARELRSRIDGDTLLPGDPGYDTARTVWNAEVDHRPALIVRPSGVADVQAAVRCAADHGLPISVRGGGHHHAGYAVGEGAVMVDCSGLRAVRVDPAAKTVTAQPGVTWGEFDTAAHAVGLATTGADVSAVGVAGATLGGGFGWLHRRLGLACDNLRAAQVVTASGRVETVDARQNPELFWALRGGGGAFAVVTSLTLAVHPAPEVRTATAMLPLARAREGLLAYRDMYAAAPDELFVRAMMMPAPPAPFVPEALRGRPVLLLAAAWIGDPARATAELRPLRTLGGTAPEPVSYLGLQRLSEQGFPGRVRAVSCAHFLDGIGDGLIDALLGAAEDATGLWMIEMQPGGGAAARIPPQATAFPHRGASHIILIQGLAPPDRPNAEQASWTRRADRRIRPHATGWMYANIATPEDGTDLATAAYGPNLARLAALKAKLDPGNLFRFTPLTADGHPEQIGPRPSAGATEQVVGNGQTRPDPDSVSSSGPS